MKNYVVTTPAKLGALVYNKFAPFSADDCSFLLNFNEGKLDLRGMAYFIWLCSDNENLTLNGIEDILTEAHDEYVLLSANYSQLTVDA